ncbi:hypothetical protein BC629DRAFT_1615441, partial [Irpex lacteus]
MSMTTDTEVPQTTCAPSAKLASRRSRTRCENLLWKCTSDSDSEDNGHCGMQMRTQAIVGMQTYSGAGSLRCAVKPFATLNYPLPLPTTAEALVTCIRQSITLREPNHILSDRSRRSLGRWCADVLDGGFVQIVTFDHEVRESLEVALYPEGSYRRMQTQLRQVYSPPDFHITVSITPRGVGGRMRGAGCSWIAVSRLYRTPLVESFCCADGEGFTENGLDHYMLRISSPAPR